MTWPLFGKLVQLLMKERMEYRGDFILGAFAQIINYGASYAVIWLFLKNSIRLRGGLGRKSPYYIASDYSLMRSALLSHSYRCGSLKDK